MTYSRVLSTNRRDGSYSRKTFDLPPRVKNITLHIILLVFMKHLKNNNNNDDDRKTRENLTVRYRYVFNVCCVFRNFLGRGLADVRISFVFRSGKDR